MNTSSFISVNSHRCRLSKILSLAAFSVACHFASSGLAATTSWIGGTDVWNDANNVTYWTNGIPVAGDNAVLDQASTTIVYNSGSNHIFNQVMVSATGAGTTLSISFPKSLTSVTEIIGNNSIGTLTQTTGTNKVTGSTASQHLVLGATTGGDGTYNISGGTLIANFISVGGGNTGGGGTGTGTFTQSSGSVLLNGTTAGSGELYVGNAAGTTGAYNLQGGTLSSQNIFVGLQGSNGSGRSFTQSGGTNTIVYNGAGSGQLQLGGNVIGTAASAGTYTLSAGVLNAADEFIGVSGTGTFTQTGGVNNVTGGVAGTNRVLYVGSPNVALTPTGTYNLNGGTLNADYEYVGNPGTGGFVHQSGSNNVSQQLGISTGGSYTMSGGVLNASGTDTAFQAIENDSAFSMTGGIVNANGSGLNNTGTFSMGGGTLQGSGKKNNAVGAQFNFTGGGTLAGTGTFVNLGTTTVTGPSATSFNSVVTTSGSFYVTSVNTTFNKKFTLSAGLFKRTSASVTFKGGFSNNGGLSVGDPTFEGQWDTLGTGAEVALSGDTLYRVGNGMSVTTSNNTGWNTKIGTLEFYNIGLSAENANPSGAHSLIYSSGVDLGQTYAGYDNNFSWNDVIVDAGNHLITSGGGALYTRQLALGTGGVDTDLITTLTGDLTIYYDPTNSANSYLNGQTYNFGAGTGKVAPVPEPSSIAMLAVGVLGMGAVLRRKVRR